MKPNMQYYDSGKIYVECWRNEAGEVHRLDGPALRAWYENGQLWSEEWKINGEFHRLDGPAHRTWYENGQVSGVSRYINGVYYNTEAEYLVAVDLYKANEIAELF